MAFSENTVGKLAWFCLQGLCIGYTSASHTVTCCLPQAFGLCLSLRGHPNYPYDICSTRAGFQHYLCLLFFTLWVLFFFVVF